MKDLTDEEYDALDELWTRTTPEIDESKPGYYTTHIMPLIKERERLAHETAEAHREKEQAGTNLVTEHAE